MNITVANGWTGAVAGLARKAAFTIMPDGRGVVSMKFLDAIDRSPQQGKRIMIGKDSWIIEQAVPAGSGIMNYICTKDEASG